MIGGLSVNDRMKGIERFTEWCCETRAILRKLLPYIVLVFRTRMSVETGRGDAHARFLPWQGLSGIACLCWRTYRASAQGLCGASRQYTWWQATQTL